MVMPTEVPAEVHNAAVAAKKNRKSCSGEQLQKMNHSDPQELEKSFDTKSPQKGKRKAPAPPSRNSSTESTNEKEVQDVKSLDGISNYKETGQTTNQLLGDKPVAKVSINFLFIYSSTLSIKYNNS